MDGAGIHPGSTAAPAARRRYDGNQSARAGERQPEPGGERAWRRTDHLPKRPQTFATVSTGTKRIADELEQFAAGHGLHRGGAARRAAEDRRSPAESLSWTSSARARRSQVVDHVRRRVRSSISSATCLNGLPRLWRNLCCQGLLRRDHAALKLWLMTRQQARSLGDSADFDPAELAPAQRNAARDIRSKWGCEAAKMRRLEEIQQRSRAIRDRIATLQQGGGAPPRATSHAGDDARKGFGLRPVARPDRAAEVRAQDRRACRATKPESPSPRPGNCAARTPGGARRASARTAASAWPRRSIGRRPRCSITTIRCASRKARRRSNGMKR